MVKGGFTHTMPFPCRSPAVPLPCRSAKALDCVFPIWFTQCGRVWFTHVMPLPCRSPAMPRICLSESDLSRPWQVRGMVAAAGSWHVDVMFATCQLMALVATTPSSRKFVIISIPISDCSGQVANVKQSGVCDGREEAYYFGARTWVLV
jgi:hypothetical protein